MIKSKDALIVWAVFFGVVLTPFALTTLIQWIMK